MANEPQRYILIVEDDKDLFRQSDGVFEGIKDQSGLPLTLEKTRTADGAIRILEKLKDSIVLVVLDIKLPMSDNALDKVDEFTKKLRIIDNDMSEDLSGTLSDAKKQRKLFEKRSALLNDIRDLTGLEGGKAVAERVGKNPALQRIPILFLTSLSDAEEQGTILALAGEHRKVQWLRKPVSEERMRAAAAGLIRSGQDASGGGRL